MSRYDVDPEDRPSAADLAGLQHIPPGLTVRCVVCRRDGPTLLCERCQVRDTVPDRTPGPLTVTVLDELVSDCWCPRCDMPHAARECPTDGDVTAFLEGL